MRGSTERGGRGSTVRGCLLRGSTVGGGLYEGFHCEGCPL